MKKITQVLTLNLCPAKNQVHCVLINERFPLWKLRFIVMKCKTFIITKFIQNMISRSSIITQFACQGEKRSLQIQKMQKRHVKTGETAKEFCSPIARTSQNTIYVLILQNLLPAYISMIHHAFIKNISLVRIFSAWYFNFKCQLYEYPIFNLIVNMLSTFPQQRNPYQPPQHQ